MDLKSGQGKKLMVNGADRLTKEEENINNKSVEDADFKCGKELDWLGNIINDFEPFPKAETVEEFRRWDKSIRRQTLTSIEEKREDNGGSRRSTSEQIDAELNPWIKLMVLTTIHVWENSVGEKFWFGVQIKKSQTSRDIENWFPVNWGGEEEEEEKEFFVEREVSIKTRKLFSFSRLFSHRNKKQKTTGCFSALSRFFRRH